jgi:hypothetical protein
MKYLYKCECRQTWNLSCSHFLSEERERERERERREKERKVRLGPKLEWAQGIHYLEQGFPTFLFLRPP